MKGLVFGLAAVAAVFSASVAEPSPKIGIKTIKELSILERHPFDPSLDMRAVDAALARAKKNGKHVLIEMGGDWCPDCLVLANFMRLKEMRPFLAKHYEVVALDVGRFDKNLDVPARFGVKGKLKGVPAVLILSADGKLLNPDQLFALSDARTMTPQAIADWLAGWTE